MKRFATELLFPILMLILIASCSSPQKAGGNASDLNMNLLVSYMTGSFNSEAQSLKDSDYFNISLEMVQIWKEKKDGPWLYIEQAIAASKEKPYRQRIYHLQHVKDNIYTSTVFTLPDPTAVIGAWKDPQKLSRLSTDSLTLRDGCDITLKFENGKFVGSTTGQKCPSDRRGASYATSKVSIDKDKMVSWDQGFDKDGKQVWGATKGGYIFIKQKK